MDNKNEIPDFLPELPMTGAERPENAETEAGPKLFLVGPNGPVKTDSMEGQQVVIGGIIQMLSGLVEQVRGKSLEDEMKDEEGAISGVQDAAVGLFMDYKTRIEGLYREMYADALKRSGGDLPKAAFTMKGVMLGISAEAHIEEGKRMVDGLLALVYPGLKQMIVDADPSGTHDKAVQKAQKALMLTLRSAVSAASNGNGSVPPEVVAQIQEIMKL